MARTSPFRVPPLLHLAGGWVHNFPYFWVALGRLESFLLADELSNVPIISPIFICGLARSGSTLLHETIASHPGVATHRVKDYPMVFTPCWWRKATGSRQRTTPRERADGDRVLITPDSPDALEEMIWMAFFPKCHVPSASNLLDAQFSYPAFETYYQAHLRKLLLAEGSTRYVAKANYHVARLPYLLRLFPDARILIPVRDPVRHIASLIRQQHSFSEGERRFPRALAQMQWSGHFEFGLDRRPMNLGDRKKTQEIEHTWKQGEEVRGWALYWAMIHDHLAAQLASDARLRKAALVVRFEALCDSPADMLRTMFHHCALLEPEPILERLVPFIRQPDYYPNPLTPGEITLIRELTTESASRWGY